MAGYIGKSQGVTQVDGYTRSEVDSLLSGIASDAITEGNSSVEVVDTGTGHVAITTDGSERVRVDSSGNVGIGTTSPSQKLHVAGTTTNSVIVPVFQGTQGGSGGDTGTSIRLGYNSTAGTYSEIGGAFIGSPLAGTYLNFSTSPDNTTAATERMRIDPSGRVTMPYQPSFHSTRTNGYTGTGSGTITFNSNNHNVGGHYNTSTGIFTAPVQGFYLIYVSVLVEDTNAGGDIFVYVNGSTVANGRKAYGENDLSKITINYNLSANDQVYIHKSSGFNVYGLGTWSYFGARLLG